MSSVCNQSVAQSPAVLEDQGNGYDWGVVAMVVVGSSEQMVSADDAWPLVAV